MYWLLARAGARRVALLAAALFAGMPMTLYFGGQPEVLGMPLILFVLATVYAYIRCRQQPDRKRFASLIGLFGLAAVTDWPAFILVPVLVIHALVSRDRRHWPWMLGFVASALGIFGLLYVFIAAATDSPWDWMVPLVRIRAGIGRGVSFTAREWLSVALSFNHHLHTIPVLAAALGWLLGFGVRRGRPEVPVTLARILLPWGLLHVLIGREGVYVHEWWWWPLTPGLAVGAALLIERLIAVMEQRVPAANLVVALGMAWFMAWTAVSTWSELRDAREPPFTASDLGRAIKIAAPAPGQVALVVWGGFDPQLWFYGDRPVRAGIWSPEDVERRIAGSTVDLPLGFVQPWPAAATGVVFPRAFSADLEGLLGYLEGRFAQKPMPQALASKFGVFDLGRSAQRHD